MLRACAQARAGSIMRETHSFRDTLTALSSWEVELSVEEEGRWRGEALHAHPTILHFDDQALAPEPLHPDETSWEERVHDAELLLLWARERVQHCLGDRDEAGFARVTASLRELQVLRLLETG